VRRGKEAVGLVLKETFCGEIKKVVALFALLVSFTKNSKKKAPFKLNLGGNCLPGGKEGRENATEKLRSPIRKDQGGRNEGTLEVGIGKDLGGTAKALGEGGEGGRGLRRQDFSEKGGTKEGGITASTKGTV